ncbi:hypothetical protein ACFL06_01555 [Patescibacteria group bacterium]
MLPKEGIKELKQIYMELNNKEPSDSVVLEMGENLLNLAKIFSKPLSKEELEEIKKVKQYKTSG